MASIKKKNGLWEIRYDVGHGGNGKRIQKYKGGFVRKSDAEEYLAEVLSGINKGVYINPQKIFLFEYLNDWLSTIKNNLSPTTYSGYEINVRCHINPIIGGIRLQELKPIHIKKLYSELQEAREHNLDGENRHFKPLSPKSILYVHRVLSKALEDGFKDELIVRNHAKIVTPPKVSKYSAKFLTIEQVKDMIVKFKEDEMFMPVYLSAALGLRRGEVLGLQWGNIYFENKIIEIKKNYVMVKGKPVLRDKPKTDSSNREIIITDRIVSLLKEHRLKQKEAKLRFGSEYHSSDFVCTWIDGKPFTPSHISTSFKLRMKKYGLPEIRFHDLRHSNAALMIAKNVPLKGASARLGHSTIAITNDLYGHLERSVQEQIAETIDKALWG